MQSFSTFIKNFSMGSVRAAVLPMLPLDRGRFTAPDQALSEDWQFVGEAIASVIPKQCMNTPAKAYQEPQFEEDDILAEEFPDREEENSEIEGDHVASASKDDTKEY